MYAVKMFDDLDKIILRLKMKHAAIKVFHSV